MFPRIATFLVRLVFVLHVYTVYLLIAKAVSFAVPIVDVRSTHYRWLPIDIVHLMGGGLLAWLVYFGSTDAKAHYRRDFLILQGLLTLYLAWWMLLSPAGRLGSGSMATFLLVWALLVVPPHRRPVRVDHDTQSYGRVGRLWRLLAGATGSVATLIVVADLFLPDGPAYQLVVSALSWSWFAVMAISGLDLASGHKRSLPAGLVAAAP